MSFAGLDLASAAFDGAVLDGADLTGATISPSLFADRTPNAQGCRLVS